MTYYLYYELFQVVKSQNRCPSLGSGFEPTSNFFQVKKRTQPSHLNASVFYSMYESFSSLNVAEDCLKQVS